MEITIEPWQKLVVHEVLELKYDDMILQTTSGARSAASGIPTILWANGIIFAISPFPDSDAVVEERLKGTIHYSSVTFAIKDKFERQVIKEGGTVNLADVSHNEIFSKLAEKLKDQSKFKSTKTSVG